MSSLAILWSIAILAISAIVSPVSARSINRRGGRSAYKLVETWEGHEFFNYFDFSTETDPTHGFVTYLDQSNAESAGLVNVTSTGSIYMGVDHTSTLHANGPGRNSVRISSKKFYQEGLFIADIKHMPGSICGVWPAFWTVGENWPQDGEIDIIEGVNMQDRNILVAHTKGECSVSEEDMNGDISGADCSLRAGTGGCTVTAGSGSYGTSFNDMGGGVYAMEWTEKLLRIWIFSRNSIPQSIARGKPDVSTFGTPFFALESSCDVSEQFTSQQFVFDTTFCGDWAGNVYSNSGCPMSNPKNGRESCVNYVAGTASAFLEAYWEINYVKVYQQSSVSAIESRIGASTSVATSSAVAPISKSSLVPQSPSASTFVTQTVASGSAVTGIASGSPSNTIGIFGSSRVVPTGTLSRIPGASSTIPSGIPSSVPRVPGTSNAPGFSSTRVSGSPGITSSPTRSLSIVPNTSGIAPSGLPSSVPGSLSSISNIVSISTPAVSEHSTPRITPTVVPGVSNIPLSSSFAATSSHPITTSTRVITEVPVVSSTIYVFPSGSAAGSPSVSEIPSTIGTTTPGATPISSPGISGTPGTPSSPGAPGTPSSPGASGTSNIPGTPGTPGTPGAPNAPGTPETPETPGAPGVPGIPGTPGAPGIPGVPGTPGTPGAPGTSGTPETPETPETPGAPGVPGVPDIPGVPGTPGTPETPGIPGVPGIPGTPGAPGIPGVPDIPGFPGTPGAPVAPDTPNVPGIPSITPSIPPGAIPASSSEIVIVVPTSCPESTESSTTTTTITVSAAPDLAARGATEVSAPEVPTSSENGSSSVFPVSTSASSISVSFTPLSSAIPSVLVGTSSSLPSATAVTTPSSVPNTSPSAKPSASVDTFSLPFATAVSTPSSVPNASNNSSEAFAMFPIFRSGAEKDFNSCILSVFVAIVIALFLI